MINTNPEEKPEFDIILKYECANIRLPVWLGCIGWIQDIMARRIVKRCQRRYKRYLKLKEFNNTNNL